MKKLVNILVWLSVLVIIGWVLSLNSRYHSNLKELAKMEAIIDSVQAIKAIPPDTVVKDTIIYRDTTIYIVKTFDKPEPETTVNHYRDSLVNEDIRVWINLTADKLFNVEWEYKPVIRQSIKTINKPYPVIVDRPIETIVEPKGFYATGGIGFGDGFIGRIGLSYMPDSRKMYGVDVMRVGEQTIFGINTTFKLFK